MPGQQRIKLIDFGLAKFLDSPERRTSVGTALGTPTYMAPEQCLGSDSLDGRADVYSLGILLYEMLAGRPPFSGSQQQVMNAHLRSAPPPLRELVPGLPGAAYQLVDGMLAKTPAARPDMAHVEALAAKVIADLDPAQPAAATRSAGTAGRRLGLGIALGALLVLGGGAGVWAMMPGAIQRAVCTPRAGSRVGQSVRTPAEPPQAATPPSAALASPADAPNPATGSPPPPAGPAAPARTAPPEAEVGRKHPHPAAHRPKPQ